MIHDPILCAVGAFDETGVAYAIHFLFGILVEDGILMLAPVGRVHGIVANKLQEREAVISVVGAGSAENDELLAGFFVDELLGPLVGGESVVGCSAVWRLLPR